MGDVPYPSRRRIAITKDRCPRCDGPLPQVIYGYPSTNLRLSVGRRNPFYKLGGCDDGRSVMLECPRCGLRGMWSPSSRTLSPLPRGRP